MTYPLAYPLASTRYLGSSCKTPMERRIVCPNVSLSRRTP